MRSHRLADYSLRRPKVNVVKNSRAKVNPGHMGPYVIQKLKMNAAKHITRANTASDMQAKVGSAASVVLMSCLSKRLQSTPVNGVDSFLRYLSNRRKSICQKNAACQIVDLTIGFPLSRAEIEKLRVDLTNRGQEGQRGNFQQFLRAALTDRLLLAKEIASGNQINQSSCSQERQAQYFDYLFYLRHRLEPLAEVSANDSSTRIVWSVDNPKLWNCEAAEPTSGAVGKRDDNSSKTSSNSRRPRGVSKVAVTDRKPAANAGIAENSRPGSANSMSLEEFPLAEAGEVIQDPQI